MAKPEVTQGAGERRGSAPRRDQHHVVVATAFACAATPAKVPEAPRSGSGEPAALCSSRARFTSFAATLRVREPRRDSAKTHCERRMHLLPAGEPSRLAATLAATASAGSGIRHGQAITRVTKDSDGSRTVRAANAPRCASRRSESDRSLTITDSRRTAPWRSRWSFLSSTGCGAAWSSRSSRRALRLRRSPRPSARPAGPTSSRSAAKRWMVAAANPHAVEAGYRILQLGGSATDAAIAVQLVLGLIEPQSSGIGGGAFLLLHDAKAKRLIAYDGRETAPAAAKPDRFLKDGKPLEFFDAVVGGRAVGVPGTVRLLETVHRRHGRLQVGGALRAGDRAGRRRLRAVAAAARAARGGEAHDAAAAARRTSSTRTARLLPVGHGAAQPRLRADAARDRRAAAPTRSTRARSRGTSSTRSPGTRSTRATSRSPTSPGYQVVVREPVCDSYRALPRLRLSAAVVGRPHGAADAEDARALSTSERWSRPGSGACTS